MCRVRGLGAKLFQCRLLSNGGSLLPPEKIELLKKAISSNPSKDSEVGAVLKSNAEKNIDLVQELFEHLAPSDQTRLATGVLGQVRHDEERTAGMNPAGGFQDWPRLACASRPALQRTCRRNGYLHLHCQNF
jgi:hypothetical protein